MNEFLAGLGATVLGDLINKTIAKGLAWARNRQEPASNLVELRLGRIAEKVLPASVPADRRESVASSLVELVLPTFEQIVEYNPTTQRIVSHSKKTSVKKAPAKKRAWKSSPAKRSAAKKAPAKKMPAKKAAKKGATKRK